MIYPSLIKRFLERINKTSNCWNWTGQLDKDKYGVIRTKLSHVKAHRVSYELFKGLIPEGLLVCHTCDNPSCVNPNHLFLGTYKDNTQDMIKKGRKFNNKGELSSLSKLTEKQILDIRSRKKYRGLQTDLSKEFNVSFQQISKIIKNQRWKHI